MYFCPCSCDDPIDPETEDNALFSLPRNLSYVQDSYLDRYSVSARFVHNPKIERCIQHQQGQEWRANVEDETLGLLSAITAQELHGRCDGDFDSVHSSGFLFPHTDTATRSVSSEAYSHVTTTWSAAQSSTFSASSLFHPASLVASKISAFLHSPPNESMDSARDVGTSVDGDNIHLPLALTRMDPSVLECPDSSGEEMDRGDRLMFYTSSHSGDSDIEERDASVAHVDCTNDCGGIVGGMDVSDTATTSQDVVRNFADNDSKLGHPELNIVPNIDMDDKSRVKVCTYFTSSSRESGDCTSRHPYGVEAKTHYPKTDVSIYADDSGGISGFSGSRPSNFPVLKPLDVESIPKEDIVPDIDKEDFVPDIDKEDFGKVVTGNGSSILCETPDSDAFIEEGVFVNIDDLDSTNEKSTTVSDASDDTCVSADSMFLSPEEGELEEEDRQEPVRKMTLEEALSRAASDLTKMTLEMYGPGLASSATSNTSSCTSLLDSDEDLKSSILTLKTAGRSSPVRGSSVLTIKITDQSGEETQNRLTDSSTTLSESPIYTEHEFNFSRVQLRKSSSLKSNKTPPGTPHRKKVVRFADAMGLDLESVRHVLNMESPPKIPASALADLMKGLNEENKEIGSRYLCPCFSQPGASDNFFLKVRNQKVSLENAIINDLTITGFVRVSNIAYHKSVRIRYTHNAWCSFYDIAASYVQNSCDGPTDRFSFSIVAPPYFGAGSRLEFAVCYIAEGVEYWDSNDGKNYVFECFAKSIPTDSETAWLHFL